MRITLVKPPEDSKLNFGTFNLAVLAAAVRDIANITILDATTLNLTESVEKTIKTKPELIGVTAMGVSSVNPVSDYIKTLRQSKVTCSLVVGGHGASIIPKQILNAGADAVVYGEGEKTFRDLIENGISEKILGIYLLRDKKLIKTLSRPLITNLDTLKEPARDLMHSSNANIVLLETSRGCPYQCVFCAATQFYNCKWRGRSPELVSRDVKKLIENQAVVIHLTDDNFTANPKRALQICELLQKGPLPVLFFFSARSDNLLKIPELIPALAKAHFFRAGIGIETLEPELAHAIKKPISFDEHHRAIIRMQEHGIYTMASFIVGLPGETEKMRNRCVDLAVEVGVDAAEFIPLQTLPGTPLEQDSFEPEPWCVKAATEATKEFRRHPTVIDRLIATAKMENVRGMLAKSSLINRLNDNILDPADVVRIKNALNQIDTSEPLELL